MRDRKHSMILSNLLVSLALSLIVNFSYLVVIIMYNQQNLPPRMPRWESPWFQFVWFFIVGFCLVSIMTTSSFGREDDKKAFVRKIVFCIIAAVILYHFTPVRSRHGEYVLNMFSTRYFNPMLLLKISFTVIVAMLYGKIYELVYQKQHIEIENEKLKNENLQTTYNMLVSQINPHFFFNSLNSLSGLVRENDNEHALQYIDRLSDTFRYIIQNGQNGMTTLEEELAFLRSYNYLLEVRYANKLSFDIRVGKDLGNMALPSLTLLPLVENAVKHNTITSTKPLKISIRTEKNMLIVENPVIPKLEKPAGTGIGLENLSHRYRLMTGRDIEYREENGVFHVKLPLIQPK